ncbi:MAG TPA: histidine kinase dimerization/phospho-acceptor domain-containing protein, partial [Azospira sp.]|nr:histidine kinase dimerization/phospho-acceptor domain-containing protein [Azospira sp.]
MPNMTPGPFSGLDLLSSAVILLDDGLVIRYMNPAAENLLATSGHVVMGRPLLDIIQASAGLQKALDNALDNDWSYTGHNIEIRREDEEALQVDCTVTPVEAPPEARLLLEIRPIDQQIRASREERLLQQQQASRELIRNLAHEIKNPLGGLRGSAQLLERELDKPELREYTQVIIKEADRLQRLMDRMLTPHRTPRIEPLGIHEVLEHVR